MSQPNVSPLPRCLTEETLELVEKAGSWLRIIGAIYVFGALLNVLVGAVILFRTSGTALLQAGSQIFGGFVTLVIGLVLRKHGWIARSAFKDRTIAGMYAALEAQRNLLVIAGFVILLFVTLVGLAMAIPMLFGTH